MTDSGIHQNPSSKDWWSVQSDGSSSSSRSSSGDWLYDQITNRLSLSYFENSGRTISAQAAHDPSTHKKEDSYNHSIKGRHNSQVTDTLQSFPLSPVSHHSSAHEQPTNTLAEPLSGRSRGKRGNVAGSTSATGNQKRFSCKHCSKAFTRRRRLRAHEMAEHENIRFPCRHPLCGELFKYEDNARTHYRNHHAENRGGSPFVCSICEAHYETGITLEQHHQKGHR